MKPEITYCLLAEIKTKNSNITSLIEVFQELVESLFANYYKEGVISGLLDDLRNQFNNTYNIELPYPTLKIILTNLKTKYPDRVTLYSDYSFSFEKDVFIESKKEVDKDERIIDELNIVYQKYSEKHGKKSSDLFKFIEQSKRDLIAYVNKPDSFKPNHWDDEVVEFINFIVEIDKFKKVFEKLVMGSLISAYFELNLENSVVKKTLLLDTNFVISLMDLHSEESYITTSSILSLAKKAGFSLEILPETIKEIRNLLGRKAVKVDKVSIFSSQRKHTIEAGCSRRKLRGSDLLLFSERVEFFLREKEVSIISEDRNSQLLEDIEQTEIFKKLNQRPFNKDGVLHDAIAMRYVKELRSNAERSFAEINSFFVTDSEGFLENKISHSTHLPYIIRAEELLNILWLCNPILDSSILASNVSKILTLHLEKKLPDKEMLSKIDAKLENYADYAIDEEACADLAINIAELDTKQLVALLNTEEKDQFKERLLEAAIDAKANAEKNEKTRIQDYNQLLEILEQENISASKTAAQKHYQEVEELKDLYDNYAKMKEKDLLDAMILRDGEELYRIESDVVDLVNQAKGRFRFFSSIFLISLLFGLTIFILLFVLPDWQHAEVYTYIFSLLPVVLWIIFYLITGHSFSPVKGLQNIKNMINKNLMGKIDRKKVEIEKIQRRIAENKKRIADQLF
jgi:hypothetical protein